MSKKLYPETDIQNIANAIRNLNGSSDTYTVSEMASAIALPENAYYLKESASANPLSITDGEELNAQSCEVGFEPIQDLNGYDSPWIDSDVINKEPYLMRAVGGTATRIGNSLYDTLVGGTVAFNQLVENGNFADTSEWTRKNVSLSVSGNIGTVVVIDTNKPSLSQKFTAISGHKYFAFADVKATKGEWLFRVFYNGTTSVVTDDNITSSWKKISFCFAQTTTSSENIVRLLSANSALNDEASMKNVVLFDLTQLFGSTIADYIYSLEQATEGSGVAYFRSLFPKDYYDYNAGQLMSVKTLSHKMVGFNQFDKSKATDGKKRSAITGDIQSNVLWYMSDYIRVFPNTVYYTNADGTGNDYPITLYDSEKNYIGYITGNAGPRTFNTGNATYIVLSSMTTKTNVDDLVLNLHWDGERDGEYEAYEEHIYPLDSDLELRGIPKLDANNNLYYDGDTYESDGTVTRKYAVVDLGSRSWGTENGYFYSNAFSDMDSAGDSICTKYIFAKNAQPSDLSDKTYTLKNGRIYVKDSDYSDATTFKTAMSGVYLIYELATSTTETADTFQNPQVCDEYGTEEYTDNREVQIPVGHETYQANICEISGWDNLILAMNGKNMSSVNLAQNIGWAENNDNLVDVFNSLPIGDYALSFGVKVNSVTQSVNSWTYGMTGVADGVEYRYRKTVLSAPTVNYTDNTSFTMSITTENVGKFTKVYLYGCGNNTIGKAGESDITNIQIEIGSTATSYEPYQGSTHTATFPDTVYGGKLDFVSGKITETNGNTIFDGSVDESWTLQSINSYGIANFAIVGNNIKQNTNQSLSNIFTQQDSIISQTQDEGFLIAGSNTLYLRIKSTTASTVAELRTWLSNNNVQIVYPFTTPQEITLTPSQIALLENNNVLWSDSNGNVKLKYFSKSLT